jgi:hypothetical protein
MAIAPKSSRFAETYSMCLLRKRITLRVMTTILTPLTTNHHRARAAADA